MRHTESIVILSGAKNLFKRKGRSFAALRMTKRALRMTRRKKAINNAYDRHNRRSRSREI